MDSEISQYKNLSSKLLDDRLKITDYAKFEEYILFCYINALPERIKYKTCKHHILLESVYPEYSDLKEHMWNGVFLTHENHFIAHSLLASSCENNKAISAWNLMNICNANKVEYTGELLIDSETYGELIEKSIINNAEISRNSPNRQTEKKRLATIKSNQERIWSDESREKLRQKNIGKKLTKEHIEKVAKANTGGKRSDETKQKMSLAAKGRKSSDKTKQLIKQFRVKYIPAVKLIDENDNTLEEFWIGSLPDLRSKYGMNPCTGTGVKLYKTAAGKTKAKQNNYGHCIGWEIIRLPFSLIECFDDFGEIVYYRIVKELLEEGTELADNVEYSTRRTSHKTTTELIDIVQNYMCETDDYTMGWIKFNIKE